MKYIKAIARPDFAHHQSIVDFLNKIPNTPIRYKHIFKNQKTTGWGYTYYNHYYENLGWYNLYEELNFDVIPDGIRLSYMLLGKWRL